MDIDLLITRKRDLDKGKNQIIEINLTTNEYNIYELDNRAQGGRRLLEALDWDNSIRSVKSYISSEIEILENKLVQHYETIELSKIYNNTNGIDALEKIMANQKIKLGRLKEHSV